eukprot:CAMPEP_0196828376 /NCGR_PEP_ID=MMETSP1362-20130617/94649_1 /TAXON_ID=163516 /ORGANISM="Leptocylindrus danicus, Strain CCMP1856" /LENGTH=76 /DNA_ID=CAMNT_0042209055 /DNA_START=1430 /DNA_END=1657 /DNA_ORIENTATION=-
MARVDRNSNVDICCCGDVENFNPDSGDKMRAKQLGKEHLAAITEKWLANRAMVIPISDRPDLPPTLRVDAEQLKLS